MTFGKILETKFKFCCYVCWKLYEGDTKKMLCLNLQKQSQTFPDSFENISVNIRFIHCKHMKGE